MRHNQWKQPHDDFSIGLLDAKGDINVEPVFSCTKFLYDALRSFYKVDTLYYKSDREKKKPIHAIIIPEVEAVYMKQQRWAPLACAYHATKGYLANLLGVGLSKEDEDWFLGHGLLEPGGLPLPYTARVIQELVSPYNVRVSRIRVEPGLQLTGDLAEWPARIGMNPMGRVDRGTTNEEYARVTGMDLALVNEMFRMEYNPESFRPGIICEADAKSPHGHASFASPRRKQSGREWLSLTLGFTHADPWPEGQEPKWEPVPAPLVDMLDLWAMVRAQEAKAKAAAPKGLLASPTEYVGLGARIAGATQERCKMCAEHARSVGLVCARCWAECWSGFKCGAGKCGTSFSVIPPKYDSLNVTKGEVYGLCPACNKKYMLKANEHANVDLLVRAMTGRTTPEEALKWRQSLQPAWFDKHGNNVH